MIARKAKCALLGTLVLLACDHAAFAATPIPVEHLFKEPTFSSPRFSPDGERIAVLLARDDGHVVLVRSASGGDGKLVPIAAVSDTDVRLTWLEWANDDRILLSANARNPDAVAVRHRMTRLFGVNKDGSGFRPLGKRWPRHGQRQLQAFRQDDIVHWLPDDPDYVLVQYRDPYEEHTSVKKMNVDSGALRSFGPTRRPFHAWFADAGGVLRAAYGYRQNAYVALLRKDEDSDWEEHLEYEIYEEVGATFMGFSPDPNVIYVSAPLEDRQAIYEYDLSARATTKLVFAHPEVDVSGLAYGDGRRVIGVTYVEDVPGVHFLDDGEAKKHAWRLRSAARTLGRPVQLDRVSATTDGNRKIFRASSSNQAPVYFVHEESRNAFSVLLSERSEIKSAQLAETKPIEYPARDGLTIPGYLTLPLGVPPENLPVIALPHGGPAARDYIRWDPEVQLFASRGYAVLQMNFRGSSGFGSIHESAGDREWGRAIQDDITDGVKWLIDQGIADPGRIGIYGTSYGGYSALMGAVRTPDLYAAAASYAGVSDIEQMLQDDRMAFIQRTDWQEESVGDDGDREERDRLERASPIERVDEIKIPILLAHGEDDPRVNARHSRRMHKALVDAGKRSEYMEFEDEVHGFRIESNRIAFYTRLVAFFEEHLAKKPAPSAD